MRAPKVTQHNKHIARVASVLLSVVYLLFRYKRAPGPAPSPVRRGGALRPSSHGRGTGRVAGLRGSAALRHEGVQENAASDADIERVDELGVVQGGRTAWDAHERRAGAQNVGA